MTISVSRHFKQHTKRDVYWYDPDKATLLAPSGHCYELSRERGVLAILDLLNTASSHRERVVYVYAGATNDTAPPHEWYRAPLAEGWTVEYRPEQPPLRTAKYTRGHNPPVTLRHSSAWFHTERNHERIRKAYAALERRLVRDWQHEGGAQGHVMLLGSPAQTGLDLLARTLPASRAGVAYHYELPPPELWGLMHDYGYQHRRELLALDTLDEAPGVWYLDGRFAYAGHLRFVPTAVRLHDRRNRFEHDTWGWYHVTATVPPSWRHVGILRGANGTSGPLDPLSALQGHTGMSTHWPCEPGAVIETWTDSHELGLALAHGWNVKIHERYVYEMASVAGGDPLRTWRDRLVDAYADSQKPAFAESGLGPLLKEAIGHLVYDTIGTFKRSESLRTVWLPLGGEVPPDARDVTAVPGGFEARIASPLSGYQLQWAQVAWWVYCVHRQRRDLVRRILATPREHVGAIRTDAAILYGLPDPTIWYDSGRIGTHRLKGHLPGPVPVAHDELALMGQIHGSMETVKHGAI